ncbi:dipeptidylaminopeptidase/acylaminoacyl-peptidase- like protein [Haloferula helveola]|uniref:Dipeptidylaminopeptidase/acylaminoacyl-peptidase- like protein n=2 Tax=Haloferula helveola TaxID=490095 RepID=A0ABM7RFG6_9BACT|nr:dipeptidylaminopeptidase/acylaminoacyl-peptidase- like protein [Haloferula helveola]
MVMASAALGADETFAPYESTEDVPQRAEELWEAYDPREEALEVKIVKEWKENGVVTRYITFKVGTFKGSDARIAAYYSFPDNGGRNPAFVWSHGGGQRAERGRGVYFAKQGFATVDINWLGRPMEDDIKINTDWGKVDPTQGPRFYKKALRDGWKRDLQPDEHTIDPVPSPRNANWFLLAVAARRAITFLEQQPEVDPDRLGFSGFSMGGMVTALTATDSRLKAVAPFVGGTGFKYVDFPGGIRGSSIRTHFQDLDLYRKTIDASAYWPSVRCPVMFISSSNDFHATFERIYRSMALLQHDDWRVSANIHRNHGPDPEQWVMLNLWFDRYLKGVDPDIPVTPPSSFEVEGKTARFVVTPAQRDRLVGVEVYYSYDPNSRTRFWNRADAIEAAGKYRVDLPVHENLPLYVFALCRYRLPGKVTLERGETTTFTLNSLEHVHLPDAVDLSALADVPKTRTVFEDFEHGLQDWASRDQCSIQTYKFQSPELDTSNDKKLVLTVDPKGRKLLLRLRTGSDFLGKEGKFGSFTFTKPVDGKASRNVVVERKDFRGEDGETLEWANIVTFDVALIDRETREPVNLTSEHGRGILQRIELVD